MRYAGKDYGHDRIILSGNSDGFRGTVAIPPKPMRDYKVYLDAKKLINRYEDFGMIRWKTGRNGVRSGDKTVSGILFRCLLKKWEFKKFGNVKTSNIYVKFESF